MVLSYAAFSTSQKPYQPSPPPYTVPGSIGYVLREQLSRQIKPTLFNQSKYHLLCEEVPYSRRLEVVPYDPERYTGEEEKTPEEVHFLNHEETHTQAFVTHDDQMILISIRGTESVQDWLRDFDARQIDVAGLNGKAHRGFAVAFEAVKEHIENYLRYFYIGQTIMICGHSLGGAIALLLAEWLRKQATSQKVILYTFGAPRAANSGFVESAQGLVHHRLVNHNDPIPAVPFRWMDAEWKVVLPGTLMLLVSGVTLFTGSLLLGGLANLKGDQYQHHGEQYHFIPRLLGGGSESSVLWQPHADSVALAYGARATGYLALESDMPKRRSFVGQLAAVADHSSDSGYTRAALANLLRLNASLERHGELFTAEERKALLWQLDRIKGYLDNWKATSYQEFRHRVRRQHYAELYSLTEVELEALYRDGVSKAEAELREQEIILSASQQRLFAQATQRVTARHVFGDLADHAELEALLGEWRELPDVEQAELIARRVQETEEFV